MKRLTALLATLLASVAFSQAPAEASAPAPEEPTFQVRAASVSGGLIVDKRGVGFEVTYTRELVELGDWSLRALATARGRADALFTPDPLLNGTLLAGLAGSYCDGGVCIEAALRYKVIAAFGAPIDHGPDFSITFFVNLNEYYEVPAQSD